jgi:hypothetical protein
MSVAPMRTVATESVRGRPRTTRGGEPAVVRTAMTRTPMGPHWPGHSPTRETNESSSGVSPVPSECGLEPKGVGCPNPMVGFHVVHGVEEVNPSVVQPSSIVGHDGPAFYCTHQRGLPSAIAHRPAVNSLYWVCPHDGQTNQRRRPSSPRVSSRRESHSSHGILSLLFNGYAVDSLSTCGLRSQAHE